MKYILKLSFSVLLAHRFIRWVYKNLRNLRNPRLNICFSSSLWQKVVRKSVSICANLWPKAVSPRLSGETQTKNEKMKSKPNFKIATSHQISVFCTINPNFQAPHVSKGIKSKANPKPIQTQYKANIPIFYSLLSTVLPSRARGPQPNLKILRNRKQNDRIL